MNSLISLLFCFIVGFFIFIGTLIAFKIKKKDKLLDFSIALAFSVLLALGFLEILPESLELVSSKFSNSFIVVFVLALLGISILKVIDKFVPHHSNDGHGGKKVLHHIAIVTTLAILIHNVIEGMALFSSFLISFKTGIIFSLGIAFHNIALGLAITSQFYETSHSRKKTCLLILTLALSTFIGGILMLLFDFYSDIILGIILSITLGMILYIVFFELLNLFVGSKNKKMSVFGFFLGIIVMIITKLL